ncbi:MAG TPA: acyl-CoA synthase, partial [Ornithinibacter sp.]|nr:acyl-CoA synthase [Ornithinibacter sp.]
MHLHPETLENLSPTEFVALIKGMSDQEIRDDLSGPHRKAILDAVFARFPHQFRPDKAGDRSARIDFRVTGGPGDSSDTYGV